MQSMQYFELNYEQKICYKFTEVMHMRITVSLEEDMLKKLLGSTHSKNKSKAIRMAVFDFLRKDRLRKIESLRGQVSFDDNILKERHAER
jgi:hypothetical protein